VLCAVFGLVGAVACVPSPTELCKTGVTNSCTRLHECTAADVKGTDAFKTTYGTTVDECKTKLATLAKCDEKKNQDELCSTVNPTDGGVKTGKYDLAKASSCSDAKKAQSCTDYMDATKMPEACKTVCTY
jgi:hypothetical protein